MIRKLVKHLAKLDDKIIDELCNYEADYAVEQLNDPVHQKAMQDFLQEAIENLKQVLPNDISEEEKAAVTTAFSEEFLKNEKKTRKSALRTARGRYIRSRSEMEGMYPLPPKMIKLLKKDPDMAAIFQPLQEHFYAGMESTWKFNATLINDFVKIAKESSLQDAVSPRSIRAVLQKHIPTKDEYVAYYSAEARKIIVSWIELFESFNNALPAEKDAPLANTMTVAEIKEEIIKKKWAGPGKSFGIRIQEEFLSYIANRIYE